MVLCTEACRVSQALQAHGVHRRWQEAAPCAVLAGGESCSGGGDPLQSEAQIVQDVLSACGKAVSGTLADIAGLDNIKQLLREARFQSD